VKPSRAIVLGAVQGPTELLPVSSSAHLTLIPWFLGWRSQDGDAEVEKAFGVALHAGAAAALLVGQRQVIIEELRSFDRRRAAVLGLSFLPAAILGVIFERLIERRLGGPVPTAAGLLVGAGAMVAADREPQHRDRGQATPADGLALGFAQAAALAPGISRNGATLSVARWRGFTRQHANMLSRTVALPVIVGAAALKGARLRRRGLPPGQAAAFAAGTAASFGSTLVSRVLIQVVERDSALWPYAAYRAGLAAAVFGRLWRRSRSRRAELRGLARPESFGSGDGRPAAAGDGDRAWATASGSKNASGLPPWGEPQ
jgi:undecaprenyl-diphosphatase